MEMEVVAKIDEFEKKCAEFCAPAMLHDDAEAQEMAVAKECEEIGMALYNLIAAFKKAKEDGLDVGDVPELAIVAVQELYKAIMGIQRVPVEMKENFPVAIMAIVKPVLEAVKLLLKK